MPGNVSDGVGAEYGGQHVLLAGLQHGHAHDDGARVQDLKSQNKGGTGNYISCRKLGYNTTKGDIFRTTGQRSVKRLIEKYEMEIKKEYCFSPFSSFPSKAQLGI